MLKTGKETYDVRLGPSKFLDENQFAVAKGDQLQVTGWKVKIRDAEVILAHEVKAGSRSAGKRLLL